jgi:membrane complex biogenesis BtpA family protein
MSADSGWFTAAKPVVGMLHAPPLPGSPRYGGAWQSLVDFVLRDAESLVAGGMHGLLLENFGDAPFFPRRVPAHTVASMTALAVAVRTRFDVPLGINVLRNDGLSALAIAHAAGAAFIRVNILCGARLTDQGIIEGIAHDLLRERTLLAASDIRIMADVNVKHSAPLAVRPLADEVHDMRQRGGADVLIVTGSATGQSVDDCELQEIRSASGTVPLWIGSGVTPETIADLAKRADGFIVGGSLKQGGHIDQRVDPNRVRALMQQLG